jgi:alpha-glucosidase
MDEMRFWLDRGVDGFRLDVVNWYIKDALLRDNPYHLGYSPRAYDMQRHVYDRNRPETHEIVRMMRRLLDSYKERMMVGEVFAAPPGDQQLAASYLGNGDDELHLSFDFSMMYTRWSAREFATRLESWLKLVPSRAGPVMCFRIMISAAFRTIRLAGEDTPERAAVLAVLLLTLRGTPFVYYGEEIGRRNGFVMRHEMADPLGHKYWPFYRGRDAQRTPMQWSGEYHAGFSRGHPWLPVNRDYRRVNVEAQRHDPGSLLHLYRDLIALRREHEVLRKGDWQLLECDEHGVLGFRRSFGNESFAVLLNFCGSKRVPYGEMSGVCGKVLLSTKGRGGMWPAGGALDGNEAVIIRENCSCRTE